MEKIYCCYAISPEGRKAIGALRELATIGIKHLLSFGIRGFTHRQRALLFSPTNTGGAEGPIVMDHAPFLSFRQAPHLSPD